MGYYNLPPTQYVVELNDLEKLLRALPVEGAIAGLDLLETLLRNALQNPGEAKYRKIRATNEKLAPLFGLAGAKDVMVEIGWLEEGEFMVLPQGVQVDFQAHIVKVLEAKSHFGKQKEIEKRSAKLAADPKKADLLRQLELDRRERAANGVGQVVAELQREAADLPIPVARPAPAPAAAPAATGGYPASAAAAPAVAASAAPSATGTGTFAPTSAAAPAPAPGAKAKSAFDFENRAKREQREQDANLSLAELRAQQRDKYKDFQADPNAKDSEAYKRPPAGPTKEAGWFDWLWGDSSSSSSGGGGGGRPGGRPGGDRQGPRMKTLKDLPAPVRRGG